MIKVDDLYAFDNAVNGNYIVPGFCNIAVDQDVPNNVYIVYANCAGAMQSGDCDLDVFLRRSTDGGITWEVAQRLNADVAHIDSDQFMPVIAVNGPWVHVIWYDTRRQFADCDGEEGDTYDIDLYYTVSDNYGAPGSFVELALEEPAIRPTLLLTQIEPSGLDFIGDYIGLAVNQNNTVVPVYLATPLAEAEPPPGGGGGEGMQGEGGAILCPERLSEAIVSRTITFTSE